MECSFSKRKNISSLEEKSFGSTIQNDEEIEVDVNYQIQAGWLKWRRVSGILCVIEKYRLSWNENFIEQLQDW